MMSRQFSPKQAQKGATLIVALIFLVVLTIAGVTATRFATFEERMASNSQFRNQAFQLTQTEIRAQMSCFDENANAGKCKRTPGLQPLNDASNNGTSTRSASDLLADPTLAALPLETRDKLLLIPIFGDINTATNSIRYTGEKPCKGGLLGANSIDRISCTYFEMNSTSQLLSGSNSWQSQGMYFTNNASK